MKSESTRLNLLNEFYAAPLDALFPQITLCAVLDCSEALAERKRWQGGWIPFIKLGRSVRYRKRDILDHLERHKTCQSTTKTPAK
jgi:hypothetical protein